MHVNMHSDEISLCDMVNLHRCMRGITCIDCYSAYTVHGQAGEHEASAVVLHRHGQSLS